MTKMPLLFGEEMMTFSLNGPEATGYPPRKNRVLTSLPHSVYKISFYWITSLNVKKPSTSTLE